MNRVYKVIFNRTKGQYEVVPEIAKNGGKAPKRSTGRHVHHSAGILPTAALLSSLLFSGGTCAAAASTTVNAGDTIEAGANISVTKDDTGKNIVIAAPDAATKTDLEAVTTKTTNNKTQIDQNAADIKTNKENISKNATAIEKNKNDIAANKTSIAANKTATETNANNITANTTKIDNNSTAIASNKSAIDKNKSDIATNKTAIEKNKSDIANNKTSIETNKSAIATNKNSIDQNATAISALQKVNASLGLSGDKSGIKYFRANSKGTDDDAKATGKDALAVGKNAAASSEKAIAIGVQAEASGNGAIAIGGEIRTETGTSTDMDKVRNKGAEAAAANATAIGTNSEVVSAAQNGIALGHGAITGARSGMKADDGTAILMVSGGKNSISIGNAANARGNSAIALGDGAIVMNDASGSTDAEGRTISKNGIAIGTQSKTVSENAMAIGAGATVNNESTGATAIGNGAHAQKVNALAIGTNANAVYTEALAIGDGAKASYIEAVAIGKGTEAAGSQGVAIGSGTTANADNVVSIGHGAVADAENSVVVGPNAGKGMVGDKNHVNGSHVVIGNAAGQNIDGQEDIALGFGSGSDVKGNYNIAIGSGAGTHLGDKTAGSTQDSLAGYNISLGFHANHYDNDTAISEATALGANTAATTQGTAVGATAKATGNGATAVGFTSLAEGDKSMALGEESIARGTGNIAVGSGSLATADMASGNAYLTGTTTTQVVSVGNGDTAVSDHGLRRIVNVADGAADQDAATIKQLKALQDNLNSQIKKAQPSGSTSGNAVTYSGPNNEYVSLKDDNGNVVQIKNVKDGIDATDAVNKGQMDQAVTDAKVHYYSVKTDDKSTSTNNYNNDGAVGTNSMAMGVIAKATQERSVAVGNNVTAESEGSIAIGAGYKTTGDDGKVTMNETKAEVGYHYNTAIGAGAQSAGDNSLAIGSRAATKQKNGTGMNGSKESIAIGYLAETSDTRGVAMGAEAKSIGRGANAIGDSATASGNDSVAIGTNAVDDSSDNSIAMGTNAKADHGSSAAVIGNGSSSTKGVNVNIFGTGSSITNDQDEALQPNPLVHDNSLIGNGNNITRHDATGITNVTVSGNQNTVQGSAENDPKDASNLDRINITGTNNKVTLHDNTMPIEDVTVMGNDNTVEGSSELPKKDGTGGTPLSNIQILGSNVTANVANSVYLGTYSAASASVTDRTAGSSEYTGTYDRNAAGQKAAGVVTVGSVGSERRIQNVAAGLVSEKSTDAVNGSQLFLRTQPLRFAGDNSTIGATSAADQNVLHRNSDQAMTIKGGINDNSKLSDGNIGVIADAKNNTMTVKLANDVKVSSVTTGGTVMNNDGVTNGKTTLNKEGITIKNADVDKNIVINDGNISFGNNQVKKMGSGSDGIDEKGNPTYNTLTNGANIGDIKNITDARRTIVKSSDQSVKVTSSKDAEHDVYDLSVDYGKAADAVDLKYTGDNNTKGQNKLKDSVAFNGTSNQIVTAAANGSVTFKLADEVNIGKTTDGNDGRINVIGKNNQTGVSIWTNSDDQTKASGGHISLTGAKTTDGQQGAFVDIWTDNGPNTLTPAEQDKKASRIVYKDAQGEHQVATMEDGQNYKGDFGIGNDDHAAAVKMNHQVNIVGDISSYNKKHPDNKVDKNALTDDGTTANVGVVTSTDDEGNATLSIKLNKDLTGLNSVTADNAKIGKHEAGDTRLTEYEVDANGNPTVKLDGSGNAVTDKAGTYVTGLDNKTWDGKTYVSGRAATEDQLMQITSAIINKGTTGGFGLSAGGKSVKQDLGHTITINGDGTYHSDGTDDKKGNIITSVENNAVKVSLNRDLNIDSTTMQKTNDDGSKVSNVTNAAGSTLTKTDAKGNTFSTTVKAGSLTIQNGKTKTTIDKNGISTNHINVGQNTRIGDGIAKIGGVTINGKGEKDGNAQHKSTVTGLTNKEFDTDHIEQYSDSGRAATESQLKKVYEKASQHTTVTVNGKPSAPGNLVIDQTTNKDGSMNYALSLNDHVTLGKDKDGSLTVQSKDGTKSITTDGQNGTMTFKDGTNEVAIKADKAANGVDDKTSIKRLSMDGHTVATLDDGMKYAGDTGTALQQKLNSTTNIKGGISDATKLSDNNIGVVSDGKDTLTVKLAKDVKGLNSMEVTTVNAKTVNADTFNAGNTTINNGGLTIKTEDANRSLTIRDGNVSMGGNQIHNVAPGTADDDAVNVSQLKKLGGEVSNVSNRVNRVGAGAAALAALHPQDFDPDDKWDFAVGYGNYRGANAAAVGAFYQPNEDTTLSVGGTVGGGENMVNVGVSWKFGQGNHVTRSRVAMAKDILALQNQVNVLSQKLAAYEAAGQQPKALPATGTMTFPDVPENHWAYQYVKYLAERGYLQGYPDGEFKGDRAMTRYEYAAIIYRALQNGAPSDGNMARSVDEFGPELTKVQNIDRFRVDRISGKDNDRHKVERVRVNDQDHPDKGDYRDVYGSRIAK
ncbi:MAG: ESPR-type extended signal peptide-containing protein [Mitsuokella sp.]|uniref:ESPR-type extended signal peptide-containing protein n=1 Tax=Mitsuokella sp. TaxID=2049034 RepID=UPI003F104049